MARNIVFDDNGWNDYIYWQNEDWNTVEKINDLIDEIDKSRNGGTDKSEPLTGNLAGFWSRRINDKDRLIYKIDDESVFILACRCHYSET